MESVKRFFFSCVRYRWDEILEGMKRNLFFLLQSSEMTRKSLTNMTISIEMLILSGGLRHSIWWWYTTFWNSLSDKDMRVQRSNLMFYRDKKQKYWAYCYTDNTTIVENENENEVFLPSMSLTVWSTIFIYNLYSWIICVRSIIVLSYGENIVGSIIFDCK